MRVLNVGNSIDAVVGAGEGEKNFQLSRYTATSGIECSVLTTDIGLGPEYLDRLPGVEIVVCPCAWRRFYVPMGCVGAIKDIVSRADIIHIMGHWSVLNALAYWYARRFGKPYVVCPAGALPIYGRSKTLKRIYNCLIGRRIVRDAEYCIAVTDSEIPEMKAYGVDPQRIVVIPNGVSFDDEIDADADAFRTKHGLEQTRVILFMGRLNPIKGPDLLVRAFCDVKDHIADYTLVIAGPDEGLLAGMRKTVARAGASDRVRFIGAIGGEEKLQAYAAADLLVIPSRQESMSIVVLEAGRAGIPVLITDRCAFNRIENAGAGIVVGATSAQLGHGLIEILRDGARLRSMGENFRRLTRDEFDWRAVIKRYIELYETIGERRAPR